MAWYIWGVISAMNINILILLCHSSMLLFSLLCTFESYYSLSNSVNVQFSNSIIRLYSTLMQFRIPLFPFKFFYLLSQFYYAIRNSFIHFPILLFALELCSSKSGTSFVRPTVHWGPVTNWYKYRRLGRRRFTESITSMDKCDSTAT